MEIIYKKGIRNGYARFKDWQVVLTIPYAARNNQDFLAKMELLGSKLQQKIDEKTKNQIFTTDGVLLFGERVSFSDVPDLTTDSERNTFFKQELFDYANPILQSHTEKLWFRAIPLTIRKVTSKWGSCTHDNRIMLNCSLVHLPTKMIQYVIIHEVCHLIHKNHSPAFWSLVEQFCPQFKLLRKQLKNQVFLA